MYYCLSASLKFTFIKYIYDLNKKWYSNSINLKKTDYNYPGIINWINNIARLSIKSPLVSRMSKCKGDRYRKASRCFRCQRNLETRAIHCKHPRAIKCVGCRAEEGHYARMSLPGNAERTSDIVLEWVLVWIINLNPFLLNGICSICYRSISLALQGKLREFDESSNVARIIKSNIWR